MVSLTMGKLNIVVAIKVLKSCGYMLDLLPLYSIEAWEDKA